MPPRTAQWRLLDRLRVAAYDSSALLRISRSMKRRHNSRGIGRRHIGSKRPGDFRCASARYSLKVCLAVLERLIGADPSKLQRAAHMISTRATAVSVLLDVYPVVHDHLE